MLVAALALGVVPYGRTGAMQSLLPIDWLELTARVPSVAVPRGAAVQMVNCTLQNQYISPCTQSSTVETSATGSTGFTIHNDDSQSHTYKIGVWCDGSIATCETGAEEVTLGAGEFASFTVRCRKLKSGDVHTESGLLRSRCQL